MRSSNWAVVAVAVIGSAVSAGASLDPPDAKAGREVALEICSACHFVSADQPSHRRPPSAPSFRKIANKEDATLDSLRDFILTTHETIKKPYAMPNLMLSEKQASDVSAYILTLRKQ